MNQRCFVILLSMLFTTSLCNAGEESSIDFNRDIRPILSGNCFFCHGPDAHDRKADLRLDVREDAIDFGAIEPGKPNESSLIERIFSAKPDEIMPPPKSNKHLTAAQKDLLKRWIASGAEYQKHWSFDTIKKSEPQPASLPAWNENPIDRFIFKKLQQTGITPSDPAKKETLIRRLYLDLTGLPPTIEQIDTFLKDQDPKAFERLVDQLLTSSHTAERLASQWLDAARYADTNGYSIDDHREMWAWRDWVIHAFQHNMPYDQFLTEQLAGDLIPNATEQQKVATGFLRNAMNTHEGGTIAEEYRIATIVDQVDTVSTVFMGLTMKCSQCHDHKYDPISQKDYYRFFAFFNTSGESGRGAKNGNTAPLIQVNSLLQDQNTFQKSLQARIDALRQLKNTPESDLAAAKEKWELELLEKNKDVVTEAPSKKPLPAPKAFPFPNPKKAHPLWIWAEKDGKSEYAWMQKTITLAKLPGSALMFVSCDNEAEIWVNGKLAGKNPDWRVPSIINLLPHLKAGDNLISVKGKDWNGGDLAALLSVIALTEGKKTSYHITDASWKASKTEIKDWNLTPFPKETKAAFVIKKHGAAPWGDVFGRATSLDKKTEKANHQNILAALRTEKNSRTAEQINLIAYEFGKVNSDFAKLYKSIDEEVRILEKSLKAGRTSVMVMDQSQKNRKTHILMRGQYDQPKEIVTAGTPSVLPELKTDQPIDRLALAKWLTQKEHPLTARVAVNRYWQLLFGTGLVKTTEDFGSQGEVPSHPELLDWLAADFVEHGWDVRRLLKQLVLTKAYQQSSKTTEKQYSLDPYNRLLGRAGRYRLQAEAIRDNALAISGLLDKTIGGPSVFPTQPYGLWKEVSHFGHPTVFTAQHFHPDQGNSLFRRSMYTFWKRTSPPPTLTAFDAPSREVCTVRRLRTNTPIQALILLNEPQFVAAANHLAKRMVTEGGKTEAEQITFAFRTSTGRSPSAKELSVLTSSLQRQMKYFTEDPTRASQFLKLKQEEVTEQKMIRHAAMTSLASLILNLDETITRE